MVEIVLLRNHIEILALSMMTMLSAFGIISERLYFLAIAQSVNDGNRLTIKNCIQKKKKLKRILG